MSTVRIAVCVRTTVSVMRWVSGGEDRDTVSVVLGGKVTVWTTVPGGTAEPPLAPGPVPKGPEPPSIGTTEYRGASTTTFSAGCSLIGSEDER